MILLDTDVLLDVALDRAPHVEPSARLLDLLERRGRGGFVAWHTLSNFYYLVRPVRGHDDARAVSLIEEVTLTIHRGARLVPLPEGDRYAGFIFARGDTAEEVEQALRAAHGCLHFDYLAG